MVSWKRPVPTALFIFIRNAQQVSLITLADLMGQDQFGFALDSDRTSSYRRYSTGDLPRATRVLFLHADKPPDFV